MCQHNSSGDHYKGGRKAKDERGLLKGSPGTMAFPCTGSRLAGTGGLAHGVYLPVTPQPFVHEEITNFNVVLIAWFQRKMLLLCVAEGAALYTELSEDQGGLDLRGDGAGRKKPLLSQGFSLPARKRSFQ